MIFVFRVMGYDELGHVVVVAEKEIDLAGFEFSNPSSINLGIKSVAGEPENATILEIGPVVKSNVYTWG